MEEKIDFQNRCLRFSAAVIPLVTELPKSQATRAIADQLLRSGMSVGANAHEARSAESRADFVHKMQIALKEAREVDYWLQLIGQARFLPATRLAALLDECNQITAILVTSIRTAKNNAERNGQAIGK